MDTIILMMMMVLVIINGIVMDEIVVSMGRGLWVLTGLCTAAVKDRYFPSRKNELISILKYATDDGVW